MNWRDWEGKGTRFAPLLRRPLLAVCSPAALILTELARWRGGVAQRRARADYVAQQGRLSASASTLQRQHGTITTTGDTPWHLSAAIDQEEADTLGFGTSDR